MTNQSFKTILLFIVSTFFMVSCSTSEHINKIYKERNIGEVDKAEMEPHVRKYVEMLATGVATSNAFNTANSTNAIAGVQAVFCNCVSKLKDKCLSASQQSFNEEERRIWVKGNSAQIALMSMSYDHFADQDMCR
jgi:hypothetical protein